MSLYDKDDFAPCDSPDSGVYTRHAHDCVCAVCSPDTHSAHDVLAGMLSEFGWPCKATRTGLLTFTSERHARAAWSFLDLNSDFDLVTDGPLGIRVAPRVAIVVEAWSDGVAGEWREAA